MPSEDKHLRIVPAQPVPDGVDAPNHYTLNTELATDSTARAIVYDLCASDLFLALGKGKGKSARWWRRRIRKIAKTYDRYSSECNEEAQEHWSDAGL